MTRNQESNLIVGILVFVIFVAVSGGFFFGNKFGYRRGFSAGEVEATAKSIKRESDMAAMFQNECAESYNSGKEACRYECDQMLQLNEKVCQMDVVRVRENTRKAKCGK